MNEEATDQATNDATVPVAPPSSGPAPGPTFRRRLASAARWIYVYVLTPIGHLFLALGDVLKAAILAAAAEASRTDAASLHPDQITSGKEIAMAIRGAAGASTLWTVIFSVVGVVVLALLHGMAFVTPYLFPIPVLGWLIGFVVSAAIKIAAKVFGSDPFASAFDATKAEPASAPAAS